MLLHLGQSTIIPQQPFQQQLSITKKISNYIFRFEDKIGQGNFSKVYKGYHQLTNDLVAIKIIELSSVKSPKLQQLLFSEIQVIQSLNHPNILKCYQVLKSQNNCYIITQLCNGGDLQSLLKKQKCLNQFSAAPYIRDIFKGLLYLGQRGIVHRDLKIANIFLHNGVSKIADFGFAKYTHNQNFLDLDIGSPLYMSPQGMIDHLYGMKTDVWSFGIILYELLHGKTPYSFCTTQYELKRSILNPLSLNNLRPDLTMQVKQLILKCLEVNLNNRPDTLNLVNDPYIKSLLNSNAQKISLSSAYTQVLQQQKNSSPIIMDQNRTVQPQLVNATFQSQNILIQNLQPSITQIKQNIITFPINNPLNSYSQNNFPSNSVYHQQLILNGNQIGNQNVIQQNKYQNFQQNIQSNIQTNFQSNFQANNSQPIIQQNVQQSMFPSINNQTNLPLQFNNNSPTRLINTSKGGKSQFSYKDYDISNSIAKKEQNELFLNVYKVQEGNAKLDRDFFSPTIDKKQKSINNQMNISINKPQHSLYVDLRSPKRNKNLYNKQPDFIFTPTDTQKKLHSTSLKQFNDNFDKASNSSWSYENGGKKKFPKILSYQNINKLQSNNLIVKNNVSFTKQHPVQKNSSNPNLSVYNSVKNGNRNLETSQNSNDNRDISIIQSVLPSRNGPTNSKQPNGMENIGSSAKKFGELIKGDKRIQGNIKSIIKLQKTADTVVVGNQGSQKQKGKTKSHLKYQLIPQTGILDLKKQRKKSGRYSFGQMESKTPSITTHREQKTENKNQIKLTKDALNGQPNKNSPNYQIPNFILQQKEKQNSQNQTNLILQKNAIVTVIQFKEAVGFLHYCRLFFRFITTYKKLCSFSELSLIMLSSTIFTNLKSLEECTEIYSRYLLSILSELINNIKSKQIIYDGQNYKKKKLKQDKLKQVTEQYYKKYNDEINKQRVSDKKITPKNIKELIKIDFVKNYNQQIWQKLDQQYFQLVQQNKNPQSINSVPQSFIKYFRNLCYFSLRLIQANLIIQSCINAKNYDKLTQAVIENWLSQQFYSEQTYFKLKNGHYRRINQLNQRLKGSQMNETQDN